MSQFDSQYHFDIFWKLKEDYSNSKDWRETLKKEEIDSINKGLKDFEEGRVHPPETARKTYGKYI